MPHISGRVSNLRKLALTLAILWLAAACSREPVWSTDERENSRHFFLSLEASQKAKQWTRAPNPDTPQFGVEEINKYQGIALREARLVKDAVLDKAHQDLRQHFRAEYQQGLELIQKSYAVASSPGSGAPSSDQIRLQAAGVKLLRQWADWFQAHRSDIKFPRQPANSNGRTESKPVSIGPRG